MSNLKASLFAAALIVHVLAAVAIALAFLETRAMTGFCVISGALIACGGAAAEPGRPITLYAAFGTLMGYAFWLAVSTINHRAFLYVIPVVLLAIGAVWVLQNPSWPSVLFGGVTAVLCLALTGLEFQHRFDADRADPDSIRRSALTTLVVLTIGLVYLAVSFGEVSLRKTRRKPRKRTTAIRTPTDPPLL
jgi:hypothetical protein